MEEQKVREKKEKIRRAAVEEYKMFLMEQRRTDH